MMLDSNVHRDHHDFVGHIPIDIDRRLTDNCKMLSRFEPNLLNLICCMLKQNLKGQFLSKVKD